MLGLSNSVREFFQGFDFVVTGITESCVQAMIALNQACLDGPPVPFCEATDTKELAQLTGKKILFLGVSSAVWKIGHQSLVQLITDLYSRGNEIVCIVDRNEVDYWPNVLEDLDVELQVSLMCEHINEAETDTDNQGDGVDHLLCRLIAPLVKEHQVTLPEVACDQVELVWNSQTKENKTHEFFREMVVHFSGRKSLDHMLVAVREAERQKREAELAIQNAKDLGNGVWKVDIPAPETALTGVMADFMVKDGVNVVIGVENAGSGPFLNIRFNGAGRHRINFRQQLGDQGIHFIDGDPELTESMVLVYVPKSSEQTVIEILTKMSF